MHPAGTIALPVGDMTRYPQFTFDLANVTKPPGTTLGMSRSLNVQRNLNTIVRDMRGDWVWLQADDHCFAPDTLIRLLNVGADIVVPLIARRTPPFSLVIFTGEAEDGYVPYAWDEVPEHEPFEVYAAGTGGMLIRRHVLDAIGDPWFTTSGSDSQDEDLEFCRKAREAGFPIMCDPTTTMGHIGTFQIWPHRQDGDHGPVFHLGESSEGEMNSIFVRTTAAPVTA